MSLLRRSREPSLAHLVVGLGNPGPRYRDTRHNLGRRAVELIADELGGSWRSRWNGRVSELRDCDERLALLVPETFMNESGRSVAPALRFYKLPPERLVVVHDELDLELGDVRAKPGGGLAGHNGLRSLAEATRHAGLPARADRRSAGRSGATAGRWPTGCCSRSRRAPTSTSWCATAPTARWRCVRDGVDAAMRTWNGSSTA